MPVFDNVQAVLFDLDGTLIDSAPDLGAAVDKMRTDRGMDAFPLDTYRHMAGAGARGMLGIAFGMTPDHPEFAAYKEEFFVNYENCMTERTFAFDGVPELIAQLQSLGLPWGLKIGGEGLHWFRRGFGRAAGHVELNALVKQIQTN
jgi:phosphoglycolate phosphatase-like HAD superfamily hydrolase